MTAKLPLPETFQRSYLELDTYPKNLMHRTVQTYPGALQKIADRLNEAAGRLFEGDNGVLDVPFRDLQLGTGEGEILLATPCTHRMLILVARPELDKENIGSSHELAEWLRIDISVDRNKAPSPVVVSTLSRDPKCRLM
jgi:hypothetical protein